MTMPKKWNVICLASMFLCLPRLAATEQADLVVIDFEDVQIQPDSDNDEIVYRPEVYSERGVEISLARQPKGRKDRGRVMFFTHEASRRKGLLNAMATEQEIPVRVRFPESASTVSIVFWASSATPVVLAAYDRHGDEVSAVRLEVAPGRKRPEDPVPTFELTVTANEISFVEFAGPRSGEFLVADEIRYKSARRAN